MRLRTRLAATFTGVTAVALIASFAVTYAFVQRDELREIDHALLVQAEHAAAAALERNPEIAFALLDAHDLFGMPGA